MPAEGAALAGAWRYPDSDSWTIGKQPSSGVWMVLHPRPHPSGSRLHCLAVFPAGMALEKRCRQGVTRRTKTTGARANLGGGALMSPPPAEPPQQQHSPWVSGHQPCCRFPDSRKDPVR